MPSRSMRRYKSIKPFFLTRLKLAYHSIQHKKGTARIIKTGLGKTQQNAPHAKITPREESTIKKAYAGKDLRAPRKLL